MIPQCNVIGLLCGIVSQCSQFLGLGCGQFPLLQFPFCLIVGGFGSGYIFLRLLYSLFQLFLLLLQGICRGLCLAIGTIIGELLNIENGFERFGVWLKQKTGNAKDPLFVDAFVTASLTVCIGAMAIVGSIQDGMLGDYSTLAVKSVLDFIIIAIMTCSMGKGCAFSAIPVFVFEGLITLLARLIAPVITDSAIASLSLVGSILIFCVGVNLVWGKKFRVANMLPAVILAVLMEYLPRQI